VPSPELDIDETVAAIFRFSMNPDRDNPDDCLISYKLFAPQASSSKKVNHQTLQTMISELGPRIPNINSLKTFPSDLVKCDGISEATVLYNITNRFLQNEIYTNIGDILVAVNPFANIEGLYSDERMSDVKKEALASGDSLSLMSTESPHVFNIANTAKTGLLYDRVHQAIVISGESGAGKTENTKKCE
jgi:myosin heavy subunit